MNIQITIAVVTSALSLTTAVVLAFVNHRNNKKIESLKSEIAQKSKKDDEIFQFLLTYETAAINQYLIALKELLQCSQEIKDRTRQLFKENNIVVDERKKILNSLKEDIIDKYAKNVYYLNKSDKESIAHSLKNLVIDLVSLDSGTPNEKVEMLISKITDKQNLLQKEVDKQISKALNDIRSQV